MDNLKLAASAFAPWTFLTLNNKYHCEGVGCHLVKYIARSMNFTFELVFQKVVGTGSQLPDGNWTGSIGLIQRGVSSLNKFWSSLKFI